MKDTVSLSLSSCLSNHNVSGGLVGTLGVNLSDEFGGSYSFEVVMLFFFFNELVFFIASLSLSLSSYCSVM